MERLGKKGAVEGTLAARKIADMRHNPAISTTELAKEEHKANQDVKNNINFAQAFQETADEHSY